MEIRDLVSVARGSQAWCYLLSCLPALSCHPYSRASGLRSPGEGKEVQALLHPLEEVSGEAPCLPEG